MQQHSEPTESYLIQLSRLKRFEVADGEPDVRGWKVLDAGQQPVGKVHDLVVDPEKMLVRYLEVSLLPELSKTPDVQHILVPIGFAQLADTNDVVWLKSLPKEVLLNCPAYGKNSITREHEFDIRKALVADLLPPGPDFYAGQVFDGSGIFRPRPTSQEPSGSSREEIG